MFKKIIACPDKLRYGYLVKVLPERAAEPYMDWISRQGLTCGAFKHNELWGIYIFRPHETYCKVRE